MESTDRHPPYRKAFANRPEAGRRLAAALVHYKDRQPVVLALPRGGVPVGFEIAKALAAPLDVLFVRKLRSPDFAEFGLGAVVDGPQPQCLLNKTFIDRLQVTRGYIESEVRVQLKLLEESKRRYLGDRLPMPLAGCTVILVDDGIVTGGSIRAGLKALEAAGVERTVLAVPVAPQHIARALAGEVDEMVCPLTPADFTALPFYYADFAMVTDEEAIELLRKAGSPVSGAVPGPGLRWGL